MLKVLRPAIARVLTPVGQVLAKTPVTPNALTIIGTIGMSAGALPEIYGQSAGKIAVT